MQLFNVEHVMLEHVKHIDKWHNNHVTILKILVSLIYNFKKATVERQLNGCLPT